MRSARARRPCHDGQTGPRRDRVAANPRDRMHSRPMSYPLEQIADAYGLPDLRLVAPVFHNGRTRAARVSTGDGQELFLKRYSGEERPRGQLEGEILAHLNNDGAAAAPDPGYRVPTCLPARGQPVLDLGADCFLLTTWEVG